VSGLNSQAFSVWGEHVLWSDMVGTPLAFSSGLPFSGLVYIVYFVLVLAGLRAWWLDASPRGGTDHPIP